MSIFSSIGSLFGTQDQQNSGFIWKDLSSEQDIADILNASNKKKQVIYKHSSRCATCYFAQKNVESISANKQQNADFYFVDVIGQRPLSMHIAEKLEIRHESPQLFVISNGEVIWHGSHNELQTEALEELL